MSDKKNIELAKLKEAAAGTDYSAFALGILIGIECQGRLANYKRENPNMSEAEINALKEMIFNEFIATLTEEQRAKVAGLTWQQIYV